MKIVKPTNSLPWNKGKLVGQKSPLRLRDIWGIRIRLELAAKVRDLALFNRAIDSKLRACDLTKLRVRDVAHGPPPDILLDSGSRCAWKLEPCPVADAPANALARHRVLRCQQRPAFILQR